jgi:FlaA1/EpsC-like NDP-sugar epimerase
VELKKEVSVRRLASKLFQRASAVGEGLLLWYRLAVVTAIQLALVVFANFFAFTLRFEGDIPHLYWSLGLQGLPLVCVIYMIGFWVFGIQRGLWRYVGFHDLKLIVGAGVASTFAVYIVFHLLLGWDAYPRSVILLTGLLSVIFLGGIRFAVRVFREWLTIVGPSATRVLIVGAGNAGEMLARDLKSNPGYNYKPVVFVDDNLQKRRGTIHGVPVAGAISEVPEIARRFVVGEIIVAIPSATPKLMQRILAASEACRLPIKTLPNVKQLLDGTVSVRSVRPLSLEDLLQREPIRTDLQELHPLLEGKRVLVTGAGGSIGSELCRQIARYRPALLVLFERHENSLYALDLELRELFPQAAIQAVVGDVTSAERVAEVFANCRPQLIFHAAAHKHVPLMEQNPDEAVRNNVFGTRIVGEAALSVGVEQLVLISTDKAVNPASVMGATKRVAEILVQDLNRRGQTRFTVVRFGNVLGSNGSVVPIFSEQIRKGGPVTVTHPEIKRYFMTIPESVQLVLQASVMGQGGDVFVLDMGEQIRVADLARNMILLSGHIPDQDIKIVFTGLRPGEKMYEELFDRDERVEPTSHEKIKRAVSQTLLKPDDLDRRIRELVKLLDGGSQDKIVRTLRQTVSTYEPDVREATN